MSYTFEKITTPRQIDAFHELPFRIYADSPAWRPPFRFEVENVFDPKQNDFFLKGTCERYLVYQGGEVVARFAVMNNPEKDEKLEPKMGGFGFLELFNDRDLAAEVIQFCSDWHKKRGYSAMRGPINFGENDNFWGLLVDNFNEPPIYGMWYHLPYYRTLLEQTGGVKLDDQFSYKFMFDQPLPERLVRISNRIEQREGLTVRPIDDSNLIAEAHYIREIYNEAWADQEIMEREQEFTELTEETVIDMVNQLKPVLMKEGVPMIFVDSKPSSFVVSVPDLNQLSRETGGTLKWWQLWRLLFFRRRVKRLRVVAYGTVPQYRRLGMEALAFKKGIEWLKESYPNLDYFEAAWISEKNWLMQRSVEALGCVHHKTHRTYKWEF